MTSIGSDTSFRDEWLEGAARAFFVMAYADFVEEGFSTDNDLSDDERARRLALPRATNGADWYDYAPETPIAAYALAGELWGKLEASNKVSVYTLAMFAAKADKVPKIDAEEFGRDLAMQAMGTGVSWFDDHAQFKLVIPHVECSQCSFSGEAYGL